jgi:poly(beta-D-mannuronate) lyase
VIDWRAQDGRYYVVAATYGRGIWRREISGEDPSDVAENPPAGARRGPELQNFPNPFGTTTTISFTMAREGLADLAVYDVNGREVAKLLDRATLPAGPHAIRFDGAKLSAGAYWYRLKTADRDERKRMTILR